MFRPETATAAAAGKSAQTGAIRRTVVAAAPLAFALAAIAVGSIVLAALSSGFNNFVLTTLINLTIVVGLYAFIGTSGVLSFGHISFMAIGAYTAALTTIPTGQKAFILPNLPGFIAHAQLTNTESVLLAGAAAGVAALVVGVPLMRLNGIAAAIATLAALVIVNVVASQWSSLTGGATAIVGVPVTTTAHSALAWACAAIALAWAFQRSRVGLRLRASREDLIAARGAGIGIVGERMVAFVLSGFIVGVAGAIYGHYLGAFSPDQFYFHITFFTLAMLVVGGINSLSGAVVGTLAISTVQEILGRLENGEGVGPIHLNLRDGVTDAVLAVIVLVIMIVRPAGITGGKELSLGRPRRVPRVFAPSRPVASESEDA
jgi:branched-chain amino acid transport system permease protein